MRRFFKEYFWTVNLFTIMVCSFLAAGTANLLFGSALRLKPEIPPVSHMASDGVSKGAKQSKRDPLWDPFVGKAIIPPEPPPDLTGGAETPEVAIDYEEGMVVPEDCPCTGSSLKATLMGTVVAANPKHSFAILQMPDKSVKMFQWGQKVDNGPVVGVYRKRFYFQNGGKIECVAHGELDEKASEESSSDEEGGDEFDGIQKVSDTEFNIAEGELQKQMGNLNALATQARIVPNFKNGKGNGFRIYSIKPGSLYDKVGIKNGDVIQEINSMKLDSPEKALEIYAKLKTEKSIQINLERRGRNVSLQYNVR